VLLVDDDPEFRKLSRRILSSAGFEVVGEAGTVAAALSAASELQPEVVLVDVGLPDGDGIELAEQLTQMAWRPRVVLISVDRDAVTSDEVGASGADGFVPKDDLPGAGLERLLRPR
jgi:DNA-binding NarL/FixJ family response regulator